MHASKITFTPRVSRIGIFAVIVFNKLAKHTHTLNKIVETKATEFGGYKVVPTQKFWLRIVYNDNFPMVQAELDASKCTALKWFAYNKAFQKLRKRNLMHRHW